MKEIFRDIKGYEGLYQVRKTAGGYIWKYDKEKSVV